MERKPSSPSAPSGIRSLGYNTLNRLTNLSTLHAGTPVQSCAFTLGPTGNRTQIAELDKTKVYTYDDLYRLTGEHVIGGTAYTKSFGYDPVGNRLSQTTAGSAGSVVMPEVTAYGYDTRDRLLTENGTAYGYDANGNLTTQSGFGTYTFDTENRLVRIAKSDGTVIEHAYDADGARIRTKTTLPASPTQTTNFLVDTSGGLSHVVAEFGAFGVQTAYYLRALDDLLAVIRPTGTRYYHADGIGSIRKLTDEAGTVTDSYEYTAFGEQYEHVGTDPQPYSFAGEPLDPNTGFQFHRARWMQPSTGRFAGMDPWIGSVFEPETLHRHAYVAGDPLGKVDPSGENFLSVSLTINVVLTTLNTVSVLSTSGVNAALGSLLIDAAVGAIPGSSAFKLLRQYGALARAGRFAVTGRKGFDVLARGFRSFRAFKAAAGPAGAGLEWHHIIEQRAWNIARFGAEAIHSAGNLIRVPAQIHRKISGYYGSKDVFTGGLRVRDWLKMQTEEEQLEFGLKVLRDFGVLP